MKEIDLLTSAAECSMVTESPSYYLSNLQDKTIKV